uniref:VPS37 C-terminal domain-containing protein n=1 Tax=Kalmanozyma brasiliensis (strain GHG001) TaxID=1365824 RepID=V5ESY3_KALBG
MTDSPASTSLQTRLTTAFPQTASLSRQDLQALAYDDVPPSQLAPPSSSQQPPSESISPNQAFFEAFFHSLPQAQSLYRVHADLLRTNEAKATRNMERQVPLQALRTETQQLFDRAKSLEAEWATREAQLNEVQKRFNPSALHFGLTQSASKLNDRSEELANAFVEGLAYPRDDSDTPPTQPPDKRKDYCGKFISEPFVIVYV